jgi:hypothetical protein
MNTHFGTMVKGKLMRKTGILLKNKVAFCCVVVLCNFHSRDLNSSGPFPFLKFSKSKQ